MALAIMIFQQTDKNHARYFTSQVKYQLKSTILSSSMHLVKIMLVDFIPIVEWKTIHVVSVTHACLQTHYFLQ